MLNLSKIEFRRDYFNLKFKDQHLVQFYLD